MKIYTLLGSSQTLLGRQATIATKLADSTLNSRLFASYCVTAAMFLRSPMHWCSWNLMVGTKLETSFIQLTSKGVLLFVVHVS